MTQEALKLALEALKRYGNRHRATYLLDGAWDAEITLGDKAFAAIKEALAQLEQERIGFAGVKIWVGNQQVVKLLTQTELDHAHDPWGFVGHASEMCIEELKGDA